MFYSLNWLVEHLNKFKMLKFRLIRINSTYKKRLYELGLVPGSILSFHESSYGYELYFNNAKFAVSKNLFTDLEMESL